MASRKLKKVVAAVTASALVVSAIPAIKYAATAGATEVTSEDTDATSTGDASSEGEDSGQTVMDDGEVVQEGATGKIDKEDWITIDDYELIAENEFYEMYLYEPRLSFILKDKKTGKIIESTLSDEKDDGNSNATWNAYMKSGIVMNAIIGTTNTYQVDMITCDNTIDVTKLDNGFSAKIYFTQYQFGLTVEVTMEGEDIVVTVPDDSIIEEQEGTYISTVSLFPFMGYTFLDDQEGYMLIPDGNGALINLDNKEGRYTTGFSQMIYGKDEGFSDSETKEYLWDKIDMVTESNDVIAPIFGMAHTEEGIGYLAVVEKGENRASIEVHPNGVMVNYNRCFAKFMLRDVYVQPLNNSNSGTVQRAEVDRTHSDLSVRYMMLQDDEANYSAMANKYRSYLIENGMLTTKDTRYNTRVDFLGTDREEFLLGTRAVTMTTTENIEEMYGAFQSAGVDSLLSTYKGWQKGGLYSVPVSKYKADSHIGGTSKLTQLIEDSAAKNYNIYLYNDALRVNAKTNPMNFSIVKKINKRTFEEDIWAQVYDTFYYQIPEKTSSNLNSLVDSYIKKGVSNLALTGITNNIYSYSYKSQYYTRNDVVDSNKELIESIDQDTNLIMEQPFSYLWNNADAFLDMPLGTSDYMYIDEEVPFLSMVLKGVIPMYSDYVNFEANKKEFLLQMVEAGVYPSFYLTYEDSSKLIYTNSSDLYSTDYSTYKDTVVEYDKQLRELNDATADATISKHEKLDNGVTVVTYSNGINVYVNYTEEAQTIDGTVVEAMSYAYADIAEGDDESTDTASDEPKVGDAE